MIYANLDDIVGIASLYITSSVQWRQCRWACLIARFIYAEIGESAFDVYYYSLADSRVCTRHANRSYLPYRVKCNSGSAVGWAKREAELAIGLVLGPALWAAGQIPMLNFKLLVCMHII